MLRLFQEILHIYAQHVIFLLTLAQLMIFAAMGSLFRGKRDAAPRFIAGVGGKHRRFRQVRKH